MRSLAPQVVGDGAREHGTDQQHARHAGAPPQPAALLVQQAVARDGEDDAEELRRGAQDARRGALRRGVGELGRVLESHRDVAREREPAEVYICPEDRSDSLPPASLSLARLPCHLLYTSHLIEKETKQTELLHKS